MACATATIPEATATLPAEASAKMPSLWTARARYQLAVLAGHCGRRRYQHDIGLTVQVQKKQRHVNRYGAKIPKHRFRHD